MFQPQPTPFSAFSSYGLNSPVADFQGFQPTGLPDNGSPTVFQNPIFRPVASTAGHNFNNHHNLTRSFKMATSGIDDLEAQEALARDFQPTLEGPLVGGKKSSLAITEEYEKADPIYVAKTTALPQKYSHYRPILGDGNCGWRAAGFSYFETLLGLGNKGQLEEEVARMTSLENLLTTAGGFESWVFEDMIAETTILLKDLASLVETSPRAAADLLRERFNTKEISDAIVYHLRLLASSWLKASPSTYQGFIPDDMGVEGYSKNWLEPVNQEIDHLGMTLLIDVLLKPIGFAVEIVYLDRSEGTQVNSHIIQAEEPNGAPTYPGCPMIHLLYRPSHYDILYKDRPVLPVQAMAEVVRNPIQVNRATNFSQQHTIQSTPMGSYSFDLATLLSIPGFGLPPQPVHHGFQSQYQPPIEPTYAPSPISSVSPISPCASSATTPPSTTLQTSFPTQPPPPATLTSPTIASPHTSFSPSAALPIQSHLPPPSRPTLITHPLHCAELSSPSSAGSTFRPSKYEWEAAADWAYDGPVQFSTSTFRNSHFNTAHYNNPNFQPEEWSPEAEEMQASRKRSS